MNKYPVKKYPMVGACGLMCGLCPRYHTQGTSRCPGCCGPDFGNKHPSCRFITCCVKQRNLEACAGCADRAACPNVARLMEFARQRDSVISYRPIPDNFAFIQRYGIEEFARMVRERYELLCHLLGSYDDGRAKMFYCTSCQLLPLDSLRETVAGAEVQVRAGADSKESARTMREAISGLAARLGIDLKLRK